MNTTIQIRTNTVIKTQAQVLADNMGLTLSAVINAMLHEFVRRRTLTVSAEVPSPYLIEAITESEKDLIKGNSSPIFTSSKEAKRWLRNNSSK